MSRPRSQAPRAARGPRFESPRHTSSGSSNGSVGYTSGPSRTTSPHGPHIVEEEPVPPYCGPSMRMGNPGRERASVSYDLGSHNSSPAAFFTKGAQSVKQTRGISPKRVPKPSTPPSPKRFDDRKPTKPKAEVDQWAPSSPPTTSLLATPPVSPPITPPALASLPQIARPGVSSPPMFGLMVQGRPPQTQYEYEGTKYTFTIPCEPQFTSSAFYVCVFLSEWYRMPPYSYVVIYFSESSADWSKLGNLDAKTQSLFLHCPPLKGRGFQARIGLEVVGQLPREIKLQEQAIIDTTTMFYRLLANTSNFDVVQARSLLLHLNSPCTGDDDYIVAAEQCLERLEQIAHLPSGVLYINQLAGVLTWLREQVLCLVSESCPRLSIAFQRLDSLSKLRLPASSETTSFAEAAFCVHLASMCGEIMSRVGKAGDPVARLEMGSRLLAQCETSFRKEIECLESIFSAEVVAACMRAACEKVNHFFGWMEANFIDDAPPELRSEARKLTARVECILTAFEQGTPWYHM
eukprot:TRINITY_DN22491_c0_g1_i1.p1 TRINITY_DN22491_c0_g1~~TRINITY_DN22491_c0_g1_i1.p1  ORF type:complete len:519 (-),score=32.73 TRINITY_DN22491_c0_g1_i1:20-1576(-)